MKILIHLPILPLIKRENSVEGKGREEELAGSWRGGEGGEGRGGERRMRMKKEGKGREEDLAGSWRGGEGGEGEGEGWRRRMRRRRIKSLTVNNHI